MYMTAASANAPDIYTLRSEHRLKSTGRPYSPATSNLQPVFILHSPTLSIILLSPPPYCARKTNGTEKQSISSFKK